MLGAVLGMENRVASQMHDRQRDRLSQVQQKHAPVGSQGVEIMRTAALLIGAFLLGGFLSAAELQVRNVTGIVTDKAGNALPGAAVQIEDTVTLMVRSYITDKNGNYHFSGLSPEIDYTLKANYHGHWSKRRTLSKFNSSPHPHVDLVILID
jgi:protocatechuate 3,4-dioxygenase beta subunit